MLIWLCENLGSIVIGAILLGVVALVGRSLLRKRREKGCACSCGGNCGACGGCRQ